MNKAVLGTIIGTTLLGLAKNRGSMSRTIMDSKRLNERFIALNNMSFSGLVGQLTQKFMVEIMDNFDTLQKIPTPGEKAGFVKLIPMIGNRNNNFSIPLKKLNGDVFDFRFLVARTSSLTLKGLSHIKNSKEYDKECQQSNDFLSQEIKDFNKIPTFKNIRGVFGQLFWGIHNQGDLVVLILDTNQQNTQDIISLNNNFRNMFEMEMRNLIAHELFHAIDPQKWKKNLPAGSTPSGKAYFDSRRERPTQGNDIVFNLLGYYQTAYDDEKIEIENAIVNNDYGILASYEPNLRAALYDSDSNLLEMKRLLYDNFLNNNEQEEFTKERFSEIYSNLDKDFINNDLVDMENHLLKGHFNDYVKEKYKERESFYSLHKWMEMLKNAFRDRGLL